MKRQELYLLLTLIGLTVVTFFSAILTFVSPLPLLYGFKRFGPQKTLLITLVAAIMVGLIGKFVYLMVFILWPVLPGFIIGFLVYKEKNLNLQALVIRTLFYIFLIYSLSISLLFIMSDTKYFADIESQIDKQLELVYKNISTESSVMGLNGKIYRGKDEIKTYIVNNFYSMFVIVIIVLAILNLYFFSRFFPETINKVDFYKWKVPGSFIWVTLFFGFIMALGKGTSLVISENIFRLVLLPYFFQGIAVAAFYLSKKNIPALMNFIIILTLGIFLILPSTIIGLIDHWLNFRKPKKVQGV